MKGQLLITTTLVTGLSAGLFYAWAVSVIPGTKRVTDLAYIEVMQSINRAILNPWFLVIFIGPLLLIGLSAYSQFKAGNIDVFALLLAAGLTYLIGTFGVTAFGNVPLNDALDKVQWQDFDAQSLFNIRNNYELKWNRLHTVRTLFSILSFLLSLLATYQGAREFKSILQF